MRPVLSRRVRIAQKAVPAPELRHVQMCTLCGQEIHGRRQAELSLILIEKFELCPNCWQRVGRDIVTGSGYKQRWRNRVRAIWKKKGWPW